MKERALGSSGFGQISQKELLGLIKRKAMIYYLAQAYWNNPTTAVVNAHKWVLALRKLGINVFSPILHTHYFHEFLGEWDTEWRQYEDYVAWDLALCAGWLHPEGITECPTCGCNPCGCDMYWQYNPNHRDDGLTLLFASSCFNNQYDENGRLMDDEQWEWASKGAHREYDWAKQNHVRCLLLDPFLHGQEVEI